MEPFYFKSFDRVIGISCDLPGLYYTMNCLLFYDRAAIEYHIKQGHIANWLDYIGEHELSALIKGAKNSEEALEILKKALEKPEKIKIKEKHYERHASRKKPNTLS